MTAQVTKAIDWGSNADVVTLPSGNVAQLRKVDPFMLMQENGEIPNALASAIDKFMNDKTPKGDRPPVNPGELEAFIKLLGRVCVAAFVSPPASFDGQAGTVGVEKIAFEDKMFIFDWSLGGEQHKAAKNFRPQGAQG